MPHRRSRDDFLPPVRFKLAARSGHRCSNPHCRTPTRGPKRSPAWAVSLGVASHITAASPGGPRYDPSLTPTQRASMPNAIWLCRVCDTMVDSDPQRYTVAVLYDWKRRAENLARDETSGGSLYRAIAPGELRPDLTPDETPDTIPLSPQLARRPGAARPRKNLTHPVEGRAGQ